MTLDYATDIATRYMQLINRLAEVAEEGELVGDLVRSAVRGCLIAMQAAGAEPAEVRAILGKLVATRTETLPQGQGKSRWVFTAVRHHMEFLLFLEENNELLLGSAALPGQRQASGFH